MERMLRRLLSEDVQLETTLTPDPWPVYLDPGQMEQVLLQLTVNARDAMPQGGRLSIRLSNVSLEPSQAPPHPGLSPGDYVYLAIGDSGVGMTPEVQQRLFEPFFTTKPPGQGSGLGLATVHGVISQVGGQIWATSQLGVGSTFHIYLPRAGTPRGTWALSRPPQGRETLLLVEDDPSLRTATARILRSLGYQVLEAADAQHALGLVAESSGPIDLLLTDVVMPGLSGPELAQQLRHDRPELPVLFVSGYTEHAQLQSVLEQPHTAVLAKPLAPLDLATTIRELLGTPRPPTPSSGPSPTEPEP
jgi:CheY-like chemotaxis protein